MNAYKSSHIRSAVRGQSRWSGYLSPSLPKRGSTGANLDNMATASLFSAVDKSSSPFTCPVDIHDAIPLLPIGKINRGHIVCPSYEAVLYRRVCYGRFHCRMMKIILSMEEWGKNQNFSYQNVLLQYWDFWSLPKGFG